MRQTVTVFGGTGFLGRRIVRHLHQHDFKVRIASRHPDRCENLFPDDDATSSVLADVNDDASVAAALGDSWAAVNAVSLYVERDKDTFQSVHVTAAERVARAAREAGLSRLVHFSGIGADSRSSSSYIRSRGEGEEAVRGAFPAATLFRPSVMFGRGDAFVFPIAKLLRRLPAFPMFGWGETKLQPCHVRDVAVAIPLALAAPEGRVTYEFGGPRVYTYKAILRTVAGHLGRRPLLVPVPFRLWHGLAFLAEMLPAPPITRNQVELMRCDSVAAPDAPGFTRLGISPRPLEAVLPTILRTLAVTS